MHGHSNIDSNSFPNYAAKSITASTVAILENAMFHPVDTIKTLLQQHTKRLTFFTPDLFKEIMHVVLPNVSSFRGAVASFYRGFGDGVKFRVAQKNLMYVGQQWTEKLMDKYTGHAIEHYLGKDWRAPTIEAVAGVISSLPETAFLHWDTAKVRAQAKKAIGTGNVYAAAGITILRNAIAASALFGGSSYVRQCYGVTKKTASFKQEFAASSVGALFATTFNNWADVLKTNMQTSEIKTTTWVIARTVIATKGISGLLLAGLFPRTLTITPRVALGLTFYNRLGLEVEKVFEHGFFSKKKPQLCHTELQNDEDKPRFGPK